MCLTVMRSDGLTPVGKGLVQVATSEASEATRTVTVRALLRYGAAVLDEVAREGSTILVTRNGRPAALISPVPGATTPRAPVTLPFTGSWRGGWVPTDARVTPAGGGAAAAHDHDLPEEQWALLAEVSGCDPFQPGNPGTLVALTDLEMEGLVGRAFNGYRVTPAGWQALAARAGAS